MSVSEVPPSCCGSQVQPGLPKPTSGAWSRHPSPWLYSLDVGTILYTQLGYLGAGNMEKFYFSCLSMIVVAGPLDKEWKRKDCSSPLVSEVLLLPPTSASMGEAER